MIGLFWGAMAMDRGDQVPFWGIRLSRAFFTAYLQLILLLGGKYGKYLSFCYFKINMELICFRLMIISTLLTPAFKD